LKRFEFNLERLARVRRVEERAAQAEWAAAEHEVRLAEQQRLMAEQDIDQAYLLLGRAQSETRLEPLKILSICDTIASLAEYLKAVCLRVAERRNEAEAKREPWQALRVELEGLGRLETKARQRHRLNLERSEAQQMDQIASERAARGGQDFLRVGFSRTTPD
jgi:flagellar export protein FliJ